MDIAAGAVAAVGDIAPGEDNIAVEQVAAVQGSTVEEELVQDSIVVEEVAVQDSIVVGEVPVVEEEADNIAVAVE